jgi:hypothetical protein
MIDSTATQLTYSPATRLDDLGTAELFVVTSFRLWMLPNCDSSRPYPDWRRAFTRAQIEPAGGEAFDLLCRIIAASALRALDVHSLGCRRLGNDEAWLLHAVGLLQRNHQSEAAQILRAWCSPSAARAAILPAHTFAASLGSRELWLPHFYRSAAPVVAGSARLH